MDIKEKLEESIENKYMQDDKGKNEMKLTVEESVYILKRKDFNSYVEEKAIQTLLNELDKKEKIIREMAVTIYDYANLGKLGICTAELEDGKYNMDFCKMDLLERSCAICIIDYFTKKVEGK